MVSIDLSYAPLRAAAAAGAGWAVAGLVPLVLAPADATVGTTLRLLAVGSSVGYSVGSGLGAISTE